MPRLEYVSIERAAKYRQEGKYRRRVYVRFQEVNMKTIISMWAAAIMFFGTLGLASVHATNASQVMYKNPVEVTGCLQQGPVAKEYLIQASDGTIWGINETDVLINDYVGQTVTVTGDAMRPTAAERTDGGAKHYLKARDLVVENESCQK
jgi:hypothetical protein